MQKLYTQPFFIPPAESTTVPKLICVLNFTYSDPFLITGKKRNYLWRHLRVLLVAYDGE